MRNKLDVRGIVGGVRLLSRLRLLLDSQTQELRGFLVSYNIV